MTTLDGVSADWSPHPNTEYVFRFGESPLVPVPSPGPEPIPPTAGELAALEAAQAERERTTSVRMYSALVQAAINGAISPAAVEAGEMPEPESIQKHAGRALREVGRQKFEELLTDVPVERMLAAAYRGEEIVPVPQPPRRARPKQTSNSYQRLMQIYADISAWQGLVDEPYFSWNSVCTYYQESISTAPLGRQQRWGVYYTKDLVEYPDTGRGQAFGKEDRQLLENRFVDLRGVPYLDKPEDLEETLTNLPSGIPALCFIGNTEVVNFRTSESLSAGDLEPERWEREAVMLANLLILRGLRSSGRSVGRTWLQDATGYTNAKMNTYLDFLTEEVGYTSGAIVCTSGRRRQKRMANPHFSVAQHALILDARPDAAAARAEK
jgi:hypothetical protein